MFEMKHLCNSLKHLSYSLLFHILNYKPILKWPWDDPPPHIYFMPLSAPCEGIPVTFHDNVRHDLSNNTKWTREMYVMTGIGQATNGTLVLDWTPKYCELFKLLRTWLVEPWTQNPSKKPNLKNCGQNLGWTQTQIWKNNWTHWTLSILSLSTKTDLMNPHPTTLKKPELWTHEVGSAQH